jgi:8-oxo-dGTP diphosphatase
VSERAGAAASGLSGPADDERTIRAAGGVVWRPGPAGPEVCLVHRPRYGDWSLPKGKLHAGEHPMAGAVREVAEETGVTAVPQVRLPTIGYRLAGGAAKSVDYWSMRAAGGPGFTPDDEVDEVRWLPLAEAAGRLSYDHDTEVVDAAAGLPAVGAVVVLLRHGYAGERDAWTGPDATRPLDERGHRQAETLAEVLAGFAPALGAGALLTARPDRCRQTLEPLAARLGLAVVTDDVFGEAADPAWAADRLQELAAGAADPPRAFVVSSQGRLIPRLLGVLLGEPPDGYATRKGHGWLLAFTPDGTLAALDRMTGFAPDEQDSATP